MTTLWRTRATPPVTTRAMLVALALALALLLAACGDEATPDAGTDPTSPASSATSTGGSTATSSPSEPAGPACSEVWKAGRRLARGYQGCVADASYIEADGLGCSSGQKIVRYDNHYYAVLGGTISHARDLERDPDYRASVASCRG